jgi:hypothetical protein
MSASSVPNAEPKTGNVRSFMASPVDVDAFGWLTALAAFGRTTLKSLFIERTWYTINGHTVDLLIHITMHYTGYLPPTVRL